jgi:predicted GIY-YIG superfamily endonuclease
MIFWAYMLHCRGGAFHVGHTNDLEHRIAQHQVGAMPGFTKERLPVELVWSQEFPSRLEALAAEKQIKGWGRAKKVALIRGDWDKISNLAKGKDSSSTRSGQTGSEINPRTPIARPERVEELSLLCHPDTPSSVIASISASVRTVMCGEMQIEFEVRGEMDDLRLPAPSPPLRRHGLWQTTCFEAFFRHREGPAYLELNFSPSSEWAAYGFDKYRASNRTDAKLPVAPAVDLPIKRADRIIVRSAVHLPSNLNPTRIALSAVIEETDGTKSYWALRHPPGAPDFHHPDCFALTLAAPDAA